MDFSACSPWVEPRPVDTLLQSLPRSHAITQAGRLVAVTDERGGAGRPLLYLGGVIIFPVFNTFTISDAAVLRLWQSPFMILSVPYSPLSGI